MYFGLIEGNMKHFDKETHVIIAAFHWQCSINKPNLQQTQLLTTDTKGQ